MADFASPPVTNGDSVKTTHDASEKDSSASPSQPMTYYHSFFSNLLSWNDPKSSAIAYTSIVALIVAGRYLDVIRWTFKLTYIALGITVAAEVAGKAVLNKGLASQLRPRKYFTIPRETFDALFGDAYELLNFFIIEAQRILFVENVYATAVSFVASLLSYFLVKFVPIWGLALMGTTVVFFAPLIYKTNKELIDAQVKQVSDLVNAQTSQLREVANKHTAHATELTKQYVGDYTAKAQQMLRGQTTSAKLASAPSAPKTNPISESDFPAAPQENIKSQEEPLLS